MTASKSCGRREVVLSSDQNNDPDPRDAVLSLFSPLVNSAAFERLRGISFLGILSPRYAIISNNPIFKRGAINLSACAKDGSRAEHCIGVARLAFQICEELRLTEEQKRYAAVWGLLHDLGNWPLSHTAQQAFSDVLGVRSKTVREWMVVSDQRVPRQYHVSDKLEACGIDPDRLLRLFQRSPDPDLQSVSDLLRSKLTPDMIEGIWRSGRAFGLERYDPDSLRFAWCRDLANDFMIRPEYLSEAVCFWRTKREIYSRFFSSKSTVQFESKWSWAVRHYFQSVGISLESSLAMDEEWLVNEISENIPKCRKDIHRWKPPIKQTINGPTPKTLTVESIERFFVEEIVGLDAYH